MLNVRDKSRFAKFEKDPNIIRDLKTKAVLNVNLEEFEAYKKQREERLKLKVTFDKVDILEKKMENIENLLQTLIDKL